MRCTKSLCAIAFLLCTLTATNSVFAAEQASSAANNSSTAITSPISIEADSAEQDEKRGLTIYKGNVTMNQGALNIRAARVEISSTFANDNEQRQINQIVASGSPATFTHAGDATRDQVVASASTIEYLPSRGAVTMSGNASLAQQGSSLKGDAIEYLIAEKKVKAAANPDKNARVKTIITPGQPLGLPLSTETPSRNKSTQPGEQPSNNPQ